MQRDLLMRRCFDLARLGQLSNGKNPIVGSLLVNGEVVKSEGYYRSFGGPHAEVNCLAPGRQLEVEADDELYVSLEPCNIQGKTPPCRDLILDRNVKKVVVSVPDPNPAISGSSLEQLKQRGVKCTSGLLEKQGQELLRPFQISITNGRPFIVLKWAQSRDGFMGRNDQRIKISGNLADRLVHKWRAESDGILIGTKTAVVDNPKLNNRLYMGPSPVRIVLDRTAATPSTHHVLDDQFPTIFIGPERNDRDFTNTSFIPYSNHTQLPNVLQELYNRGIGTLLIEGGKKVLQHCLDHGLWDECRVVVSKQHLKFGIQAPKLDQKSSTDLQLGPDRILNFRNKDSIY